MLEGNGYGVAQINVENYLDAAKESFDGVLCYKLRDGCGIDIEVDSFSLFFDNTEKIPDKKCVLIIDEVEGLNPELLG